MKKTRLPSQDSLDHAADHGDNHIHADDDQDQLLHSSGSISISDHPTATTTTTQMNAPVDTPTSSPRGAAGATTTLATAATTSAVQHHPNEVTYPSDVPAVEDGVPATGTTAPPSQATAVAASSSSANSHPRSQRTSSADVAPATTTAAASNNNNNNSSNNNAATPNTQTSRSSMGSSGTISNQGNQANNRNGNNGGDRRGAREQVRNNFRASFNEISRSSKILLFIQLLFILIQASVYFTLFGIATSLGQVCETAPLNIYIGVDAMRLVLSLPIVVYTYVQHYHDRLREPTHVRVETFPEKMKNLLDIFATLWFVLGNWWLFAAGPCIKTAPIIYYLSLSMVIFGYVILLFPVFMVLAIIFCLPLVILAIRLIHRLTGINLMENENLGGAGAGGVASRSRGATQDVLSKIPSTVYQTGSTIATDDAHCVICLGDYTEGESIKTLPGCHHHFHASCADEWLTVNRTCPLCVRDVVQELEKERQSPSMEA